MPEKLDFPRVSGLLSAVVDSFPHEECRTCECFIGYVVRLEIDSDGSGRKFTRSFIPARSEVHSCLGCDPCPPSDQYAEYVRTRRRDKLQDVP